MQNIQDAYSQLAFYTLNLGDSEFIHQLIVDAYAAQNATSDTKPITLAFALVGLYLVNEKGYTGKQVQNVHVKLAKSNSSKKWPPFKLASKVATINTYDILAVPDSEKQNMIREWNRYIWGTYKDQQEDIKRLLFKYLGYY